MPTSPMDFIARLDDMKAASTERKAALEALKHELASREADASLLQQQLSVANALHSRTKALIALTESDADHLADASHLARAASAKLAQRREVMSRWQDAGARSTDTTLPCFTEASSACASPNSFSDVMAHGIPHTIDAKIASLRLTLAQFRSQLAAPGENHPAIFSVINNDRPRSSDVTWQILSALFSTCDADLSATIFEICSCQPSSITSGLS